MLNVPWSPAVPVCLLAHYQPEPAQVSRGLAQRSDRPVDLQQRLLHHILDGMGVIDEPAGHPAGRAARLGEQPVPGRRIAGRRGGRELAELCGQHVNQGPSGSGCVTPGASGR